MYLLLGALKANLRQRAVSLPPDRRAELIGVLDDLEHIAHEQRQRPPVALNRRGDTPPGDEGPPSGWCTTTTAATRIGCSVRTVQRLVADELLTARRTGRTWLVSETTVAAFAVEWQRRTAA